MTVSSTTHQSATGAVSPKAPKWRQAAPGLLVAAVAAAIGLSINAFLPTVSALLITILLGVIVRNTVGVRESWERGIQIAAKPVLRIGIVLLGLQLALNDVLNLGFGIIALVVAIVAIGVLLSYYVGRLLKLSRTQSLLIASGFSICGAAAVAAADGVIDAEEEEVVTAVALVVIFGTLMIPLVPALAGLLDLDDQQAGILAGGSIHEVAQVVAVGGMIGSGALATAVIVKLARVVLLAPMMAVISILQRRAHQDTGDGSVKRPPLIPLFVLGFIAMMLLRTTGIVPEPVLDVTKIVQTFLLAAAMFGLGCGVKVELLKKVGAAPFVQGIFATVLVLGIAMFGVLIS
ncbi:YeiH family protein [Micrococcoides hystricis]|uniref:YeiH family protein n=1 Tax=Micrococcoides hystricis TaxID=1572761 RepID=A0ABV6PBW5_9MICC